MPYRITKHPHEHSDTPLLVAFLILGLVISAIFWYGGKLHNTESTDLTGQQLYNLYCAACHGYNGEGVEALNAPALNSGGTLYEHADGEIQRAILTGGELMPKHDTILSTAQAADIVQYIKSWWTDAQTASQEALSVQDPMQP